ncbi:hypothetical protein C8Q80DRAFT_1091049 [Daedaleopsis nitida]|nr:hypothetical protein C8Q80DRAFT_1091049 [Daedaleopsis nitida]
MVSQTVAPGAAFKSLSPNDAIQFILADIPIFTVGVLAFGTLTFFFLMKRIDRWIFCLHMSVLLSFLASLLDLSQLLQQGRNQVAGAADPTQGLLGFIQAREIFYSFANGLRFLFYWGFVAMIPLGETIPEGNKMHSGSWRRWGMVGMVLKWSTFILTLVMTILQIVYRDVPSLEQIGPAYEAEATLEIILSAVFILKLLLNTWARYPTGATTQSKGKMLVQYAPMIVALLFSLWIAVGNVVLFEFTETALGRFMRAIELYVALIYMLTISFHHLRHLSFFPVYRPAAKGPSRSNTFNRSSIDKKGDYDTAQAAPVPNLMEVLEEQYRTAQAIQTVERNSARSATVQSANQHQSMVVRLSTWLGVGRPQQRSQEVQPWDVDTERGPSPVVQTTIEPWYAEEKPKLEALAIPLETQIDEDERRGVSPLPDYPPKPLPIVDLKAPSSHISPFLDTSIPEPAKTPVPDRDWNEIEYSNAVRYSDVGEDVVADALEQERYERQDNSPMATNIQVVSPSSDDEDSRHNSMNSVGSGQYLASPYPMSPLASAGVTPIPRSRPLPPMPMARRTSMLPSPLSPLPPDSARSSNMSILLRQQTELDQTIEALRLTSPSKQIFDINAGPTTQSIYYQQYAEYNVQQTTRLSPIPSANSPDYSAPSPDLTLTTPRRVPDSSTQSEFYFDPEPPRNRSSMDSAVIPVSTPPREEPEPEKLLSPSKLAPPRAPMSRFSDSSSVRRERRVDSMGTQYDITSFVGNLTIPVNPKDSILSAGSTISEEGSVGVATVARPGYVQLARPTLITQVSRQEGSAPSPIRSPSAPSAPRALPPLPQPAQSANPPRFRRAVGLPARPRLEVANLTPVEERGLSPSDSATLVTPRSGSGTPMAGKAW